MRCIQIKERLKPFSHLPGTSLLIPGTVLQTIIFPTKILITDLSLLYPDPLFEIIINFEGPIENFTISLDLERMRVQVAGKSQKGFFDYFIYSHSSSGNPALKTNRMPKDSVGYTIKDLKKNILQEKILLPHQLLQCDTEKEPELKLPEIPHRERLSLGSHRKQDWDQVLKRLDMREILPFLFFIGQTAKHLPIENVAEEEVCQILNLLQDAIEYRKKEEIILHLKNVIFCNFNGILSPQLEDSNYHGITIKSILNQKASALSLLPLIFHHIRSLFFSEAEDKLLVLPCLPSYFHCGRLLGIHSGLVGLIDMEWSKKTIRRLILKPHHSRELNVVFCKSIKRFRLRRSAKEKGEIVDCHPPIIIEKNNRIFLDNFEK